MFTCVFVGHREVYHPEVAKRLEKEIEKLLQFDNELTFLTGGMGKFDDMGASAVRAAKSRHPEKSIKLNLVLAYPLSRLNTEKDYYRINYDQIVIPSEVDTAHYKTAIQIRNCWMVNQANAVISYVFRDFGGAFTTLKYAQKQGKRIINLA